MHVPLLLAMVVFEVLMEFLSIPHQWLTVARRNFYQPVLVWVYCDHAIMEVWHGMYNMYLHPLVGVRLKFLS